MKKKMLLVILVIFLTIGYAAVNTNLFIEVYSSFAFNESDLNVYFSGAYLDEEDYSNEVISEDKKSIVVSGESLVSNGSMVISYDITNASTSYDAIVNVECVSSIDGVTFVSTDENLLISAREVGVSSTNVSGTITEALTITCELKVSASGRTEASNAALAEADEYVVYGTLADSSGNSLANANVVIYSETPHYATTDEDGYLFYNGIEKGSHEIYYVDDTLENIKSMSKDEVKSSSTINGKFTTRSNGVIALSNGSIKEFGSMEVTPFCESLVGTTWKYEYTGSEQAFLTYCDGNYKVELWGAQGGDSSTGGLGAYTFGNLVNEKNDLLWVVVGGSGFSANGYNGGGTPVFEEFAGGGATDIRTETDNLYSRIMVAAGGSGSSSFGGTVWNYGVAGGGLIGYDGLYLNYNCSSRGQPVKTPAGGATQISPGAAMTCETGSCMHGIANSGYFGIGAKDNDFNGNGTYGSGGGGAGWYGGGGGTTTNCDITSSASGSSYISGHIGSIGTKSSTSHQYETYCTSSPDSECSKSYTGYYFTNTKMIDGAGYSWTTEKGSTVVGMPTHDGTSTMTGNSGNGYAKITLISLN